MKEMKKLGNLNLIEYCIRRWVILLGYLEMYDDGKEDYKVISVVDSDPRYNEIHELKDIPEFTLEEIKNFFENYKQLENTKVKVGNYHSKEEALKIIKECKNRYSNLK